MFAAVDVQYRDPNAVAGCVLFSDWQATVPAGSASVTIKGVAPYVPGRFFERELPCILAVLNEIDATPEAIIIDGYVWLAKQRPGLGQYLFEALGAKVPVIGVAKQEYSGNDAATAVFRGSSKSPLFVSAIGVDVSTAANNVVSMHGPNRIPTLLKCVDGICRAAAKDLSTNDRT